MTSNKQVHKVTTVTDLGTDVAYPPHTNHDFAYTYSPTRPHQATQIGDMFLTYDGNGNTTSECRDHADPTCSVNHDHYRSYQWTEDNRLASVVDGGGRSVTRFIYDAAGARLVKFGSGGASITIGQFFNVKGRTAATKHVFAGTARLASKLLPPGDFASPTLGAPLTTTVATTSTGATAANPVGDGSPNENGCDPSDYQPQKCPILVNGEPVVPYPFQDTKVRPATYYYHPDHLGSTSWVTDQNGKVHEHVDYFPYGEVWRDPASDRDGEGVKGQRFLFSGKELDEETGLYYFGARYYDPVRIRWASTDPALPALLEKGGPAVLHAYRYAANNPLRFVDPTGLHDKQAASTQAKTAATAQGATAAAPSPAVPSPGAPTAPAPAGDNASPWQVGVEWLTGKGPRVHQFKDGDPFTEQLRSHKHIRDLVRGVADGSLPPQGRYDYTLRGVEGIPKYFGDYSTLLTGGATGNLAVTFLGSYNLQYSLKNGVLDIHVYNASSIASATHPPVIGYTNWWNANIGRPLNNFFSSGPMSKVEQTFDFHEHIPPP